MHLTIEVVIATPAEGSSFEGYFDSSNKKIFTKIIYHQKIVEARV